MGAQGMAAGGDDKVGKQKAVFADSRDFSQEGDHQQQSGGAYGDGAQPHIECVLPSPLTVRGEAEHRFRDVQ